MLALAGLPFFIISLADPRTALTRSETTFPGRRIALLIDASSSMLSALPSTTLAKGRAEQRRLLHHRRRRALFHRAAHGGQVSRPDGARSNSATMRM
jgi:hypothetical protein